jgi:hypothetical protein
MGLSQEVFAFALQGYVFAVQPKCQAVA